MATIVFDFDGTLIDSAPIKIANYAEAFRQVFGPQAESMPLVHESVNYTAGANRFVQLDDTLERTGMTATEEQRQLFSERYSALNAAALKDVPEFPSVHSLMERLGRDGHHLYATTGILDDEFRGELDRRNLAGYFLGARGGDKEGYLTELKGTEQPPVIFVGDTSFDEATARDVGVAFYRITGDQDLARLADWVANLE